MIRTLHKNNRGRDYHVIVYTTYEDLFLLRNIADRAYGRKTSKIYYSASLHLSPFLSRLVRFTGLHLSSLPKSKVMDTIPDDSYSLFIIFYAK